MDRARIRQALGPLVLLLAVAAPARGDDAAQEPIFLQRITVVGARPAIAKIVVGETLLREGETYTEDDLRQAVRRVHRLPFVVDATFALRKGTERGAYELVIEVRPAGWFFYDWQVKGFRLAEPLAINPEDFSIDDDTFTASSGGLIGVRRFLGSYGVAFAVLDSEEGGQIGYSHYNLADRGGLISFAVSANACCITEVLPFGLDPTFAVWNFDDSRKFSLTLTAPLSARQSLQLALSERKGDAGQRIEVLTGDPADRDFIAGGDLSYERAELKWVYDTSDDPVVPTHGMTLAVGMEGSRFAAADLALLRFDPGAPGFPESRPAADVAARQVVGAVSAVRHWSLRPRHTVTGNVRLAAGRSEVENLAGDARRGTIGLDYAAASAGARYSFTLRRARGEDNLYDLRLETGGEIGMERTLPDLGPSPLQRLAAWVAVVFRNQWGRIRVSLSYLDVGEILR